MEKASALIETEIARGTISAASLTVARNGEPVFARGFGFESPASKKAVEPDSVFLLASISKPISICGLMLLVDQGVVGLDDRVREHLPEFEGEHKEKARIRHLLTHTSGMPDMLPENIDLRRAHTPMSGFVAAALKTPLLFEPGTGFRYQSKGILLASEIVARKSGRPFRDFLRESLFEPVGMSRTSLGLGGREIADTVWCGADPNDERSTSDFGPNSPYWRDAGNPWGGVHSTGPDLTRLLHVFLNDGRVGNSRLFGSTTAGDMIRDQNTQLEAPWGLGWGLRDSLVWTYFGNACSARTFGHTGSTGTVAWADPETKLSCVILTNEMVEDGRLLKAVSNAVVEEA